MVHFYCHTSRTVVLGRLIYQQLVFQFNGTQDETRVYSAERDYDCTPLHRDSFLILRDFMNHESAMIWKCMRRRKWLNRLLFMLAYILILRQRIHRLILLATISSLGSVQSEQYK